MESIMENDIELDLSLESPQTNIVGNSLKETLKAPENISFAKKLTLFINDLKNNNFLDYDKTVEEIFFMEKDARVNISNENDIHAYLKVIDKIQGYRDRATEIYCKAHGDFLHIDKFFDTFQKVCLAKSKAKSLDKREGEVEEVLLFSLEERTKRESLLKHAEQIIWNLNSKFDSIKLKISILHHTLKTTGGTDSITRNLTKKDDSDSWEDVR